MEVVDIARWQFGIITVYHFLFVPITIGLSAIVAVFETQWLRTKDPAYLRLTKFFGKLFLINFAIGVVTGIVQEFQFGMNWSDYSRFVGDVFGAPLAIEGLLAFFLESTFLGLWIFGWDKLPRALHAACMWLVHLGTLFSSYFILAANSWMQNPVGHTYNPETGRAELIDFWAVMVNEVQLVAFPHVITASYMTGGAFVLGVAGWLYLRKRHDDPEVEREERSLYRKAIRIGAVTTLVAGLGVTATGDLQGKVMTDVQPMKMAAAEGLYESADSCAPFSVFTVGSLDGREERFALTVPCLLSWLGTGSFDGEVKGIEELRDTYREAYGQDPGEAYYHPTAYAPVIPVTYWTFRLMIAMGLIGAAGAAAILWFTRGGRMPRSRWWPRLAITVPVVTVLGSSFGWLFTEMGRQPWAVYGLMTTPQAVSPGVSVAEALTSVLALTLVYAVLAVVEVGLLVKFVKAGPEPFEEPPDPSSDDDADRPMTFAY